MKNDWNRVNKIHTQHESQSYLKSETGIHCISDRCSPGKSYEISGSSEELRKMFLENACNCLTHNSYNFPKADLLKNWRRFLENCISLCCFYFKNQAKEEQRTLNKNNLWLLLNRQVPLREKDTKAFQIFNQADCILLDEAYLLAERFDYENECNETGKRLRLLRNRSNILRRKLKLHIDMVKIRIENWISNAIARKQYFRRQSRKQMVNDYRNEQMNQIKILRQCGKLTVVQI